MLLQAYGRGVQKYACPVSATSKAAPHAILLAGDRGEGDLVAIHFKEPTGPNPTWQALDGSSVVGDAAGAKHFPAPDPDGVDWLLLEALSTAGKGVLGGVTFIQRLYTDGGKPPPAGCDPAINQTEVLVEYSAQYLFYGPAAKHRYYINPYWLEKRAHSTPGGDGKFNVGPCAALACMPLRITARGGRGANTNAQSTGEQATLPLL